MKKLILIIAAVALLAACSKKQTPKPVISLTPQNATIKDIAGTWTVTTDTVYTITNGQTTTQVATNTNNTYFQFSADGTGLESVSNITAAIFTYDVTAGVLTLHYAATPSKAAADLPLTIVIITANKLILRDASGTNLSVDLAFTKN